MYWGEFFKMNKKGLTAAALVSILLLLAGAGMLAWVFSQKIDSAKDDTKEALCRGLNSIRSVAEFEFPIVGQQGSPRGCMTIHKVGNKNSVPTYEFAEKYTDKKDAAIKELRDMTRKCWWMWLDGKIPDMFNQNWYSSSIEKNRPGFICYTFELDDEVGEFASQEFFNSLEVPLFAVDDSDKCAIGGGGKCSDVCGEGGSVGMSSETISSKCEGPKKCCIVDRSHECDNKGGKCAPKVGSGSCSTNGYEYGEWKCPSEEVCCVHEDNMVTYFDYIQGTGGSDSGPGGVIIRSNQQGINPEDYKFESGKRYAISFFSPGEQFSANTAMGLAQVGSTFFVYTKLLRIGSLARVAATSRVGTLGAGVLGFIGLDQATSGDVKKTNYIVISEYGDVRGTYLESTFDEN
tara:strand:- start:16647 stop:17858 length:1212 start_codon:yes stop_codon:yes gene_type:complete